MSDLIEELVKKYFTDSLNSIELDRLLDLLKDKENQRIFKKYVKDYYDLNLTLQDVELNEEYLKLIRKIDQNKNHRKFSYRRLYRIAAVFIVLVGIGYFFSLLINSSSDVVDKNVIIITLENGTKKIISEDGNEKIVTMDGRVIGTKKGARLDYNGDTDENTTNELTYNELSIPYGKTFQLVLSDGTLVHLNAGTSIRYPVKFLKNRNREVFLKGEAYFEVEKDKDHPFIVNATGLNLKVLGTKFNVNSYTEGSSITTVLVEGSVGLYNEDEVYDGDTSVVLAPGQIASWDKAKKNIQVDEVDVNEYIAWTQGRLLFKRRPFSEILKVLERHYNVSITNNYMFLDNQRFFAKFDSETIEQILISFQNSQPFLFEINGNDIIINKP